MNQVRLGLSVFILIIALAVSACATGATATTATRAPEASKTSEATNTITTAKPTETTGRSLTVYSGREEKLVGSLIERFGKESGIDVKVRYGDSAELAAAILEEGKNSPADVFFAQDAGALGALTAAQRFTKLPDSVSTRVDARFRAPLGEWVGISGRARVVVYNTDTLKPENLPDSIAGFTDPKWKGKIGWAPTNGSFQSFVTALRATSGEEAAKKWLQGVQANNPKVYKNNTAIVNAVGSGEVEVGFVNHYYLYGILKEKGESFPARNYHLRSGDSGSMINVAGAGILSTTKNAKGAEKFVEFLLSNDAQQYFADQTFEYPLVEGIKTHPMLVPIKEIKTPQIDLGSLADLQKTLSLLRDTGVL